MPKIESESPFEKKHVENKSGLKEHLLQCSAALCRALDASNTLFIIFILNCNKSQKQSESHTSYMF